MPPGACDSAFRRPGPAWKEELAAASSSTALASWNAPNNGPEPTDALARLAIWVESGPGTPTRRRTANTVRPSVSHPTTTNVSQSVTRPNMIWEGRSS